MRIVIDLQSCQSGSRLGGIGRYSLALTKAIVEVGTEHDIWILLNGVLADQIDVVRTSLSKHVPQSRIVSFDSLAGTAEAGQKQVYRAQIAELIRESFIREIAPDFVLITSLFEGLGDDVVTSVASLEMSTRTAVILYDLIPYVQQDRYLGDVSARNHYMRKFASLADADLILSISEFSRTEGLAILDVEESRLVNISSSVDNYFVSVEVDAEVREKLLHSYGITKDFLLYTGSFDQRKNHRGLIDAIALLGADLRQEIQLVVVGNGNQEIYADLSTYAGSRNIPENLIRFVGNVSDSELRLLYSSCRLFVFPSFFEGFGLPILEAMRCGAVAIGSNSTSIPEVLGFDDALFDPHSPDSISKAIVKGTSDEDFRARFLEHARVHIENFGWRKSAARALQAMERQLQSEPRDSRVVARAHDLARYPIDKLATLLAEANAGDDLLAEVATTLATNTFLSDLYRAVNDESAQLSGMYKGRVGFVTTWATKCGIASFSKFVLDRFQLPFVVLAPYIEGNPAEDPNVVRCWKNGSPDDLSELKGQVLGLEITDLVIQFNYGFFDFGALDDVIRQLVSRGVRVYVEFHSTVDPPPAILDRKLMDIYESLSMCSALFVHSIPDRQRLSEIGLRKNVKLLRLGVHRPILAPMVKYKRPTGFLIASYGFFLPHKGLLELITAFASIESGHRDVHLLLLNAEYPAPVSRELIGQAHKMVSGLGLGHRVTINSEFLSDSESFTILSQADLIVFPYQQTGESASAAVRLGLATGRPVLTTPLAIFDEVADISLRAEGTSVPAIAAAIEGTIRVLGESPGHFTEMGERVELWLRSNSDRSIASQLAAEVVAFGKFSKSLPAVIQFDGSHPSLRSVVGERHDGAITSIGAEGILVFGPYISLAPGDYDLVVYGSEYSDDRTEGLQVRLLHTDGSHLVPFSVAVLSPGQVFRCSFVLTAAVRAFETQIHVSSTTVARISGIKLTSARRLH